MVIMGLTLIGLEKKIDHRITTVSCLSCFYIVECFCEERLFSSLFVSWILSNYGDVTTI